MLLASAYAGFSQLTQNLSSISCRDKLSGWSNAFPHEEWLVFGCAKVTRYSSLPLLHHLLHLGPHRSPQFAPSLLSAADADQDGQAIAQTVAEAFLEKGLVQHK